MGKRYCLCCSNYKGKDVEGRKVTLHRVPADKKLRKVWWSRLKLIRKDLDSLKDHARVCSEHFVNKKGPQPGDDVPSIFPNVTFKANSRLQEAPPVLKKVRYLAQTEATVMEDGTKSDRIIEQFIVVTKTSKTTRKKKKEKKTIQQRVLYSLLGNTAQSLSLLGCWHQPGPSVSVSATDRRQPPGPQVVSQVKKESDVTEETAESHCKPLLMSAVKRESDVAEETAESHCKPLLMSEIKRESDVAEETAESHCKPLLMSEMKRESDVTEETAESHCKPLLMSEVKRESDVAEGTPESWMVKEIAEVPGVHCPGEEAMSCVQVEWRTDARSQLAAKQPVLPGPASCDGMDCTDPALMMSEVKVEIDVAEEMSASWETEELVSAPKGCWVSRDDIVPWVEMPEEQSDPQAVPSSSMDVKVKQETEPQRCSPSHRDHERRQAGGCPVSGVDTGAVGARDSCRGGPAEMWLTGKPGFKYSYENLDSEMFMKAEALSPVCSALWHVKHEPMDVRDAAVFNVQCVKSEPF